MNEPLLVLEGIKKSFGKTPVLRGIDLAIQKGEFFTFLGSSGCGKTTTLRIIAGLEEADEGKVYLEGRDISGIEPHRRNIHLVFQNYALFPHMNVENNVAYSLKLKRLSRAEIRERRAWALDLVQLGGYEKRMPQELSGGQKQRVALARALANRPPVLLLDEPLGALDLQLRRKMQLELKRIQRQLGITFIYITHDQEEALTMSDRIAVMRDGLFEQIGSAADVYERPLTAFAARFVGSANILRARAVGRGTGKDGEPLFALEHPAGRVFAAANAVSGPVDGVVPGRELTLAVRSEHLLLRPFSAPANGEDPGEAGEGRRGLSAVVTEKSFAGGQLRIGLVLRGRDGQTGEELVASRHGMDSLLSIGDVVKVDWELPRYGVVVRE
ncbi:MAG: ABC transporter ATP-binding protein [Treponema sp.]|nr:ABC transporter ATP-binding protein [Treponema sp.]